jgi:alginate O-acetyltransferase complex protein AlgJ
MTPPPQASGTGTTSPQRWHRVLVVLFLSALVLPDLDLALGLDPNPSPTKDPAVFPTLHLDRSLLRAPGQILWYLKTSMGFRGSLVRARSLVAWKGLRTSSTPESVLRSDPWLFLRAEKVVDDFRRIDLFTAAQLDRWRDVLEARRRWLARRGIHYLIVVAPNKETVYAEAVPGWVTREPGPSRLTQFAAMLRRAPSIDFLDLSTELRTHKAEGRLYHYTDTHWNDLGAFFAYQALSTRLKAWFPGLRPLERGDVVQSIETTAGGDLSRMCGLKADLQEPQVQLRLAPTLAPATFADGTPLTYQRMEVAFREELVTVSPQGEIPSAVILRDSFGESLLPFVSRHMQTASWVWTYDFPARVIEERRPAVVIEQLVERKLMTIEPSNPPEVR